MADDELEKLRAQRMAELRSQYKVCLPRSSLFAINECSMRFVRLPDPYYMCVVAQVGSRWLTTMALAVMITGLKRDCCRA